MIILRYGVGVGRDIPHDRYNPQNYGNLNALITCEVLNMSTGIFFSFSLAVVPVPQMYGLPLVCLQFLREPWETMKSIKRLQKVSLKYMYREERREKKKMMLEGKREGRE